MLGGATRFSELRDAIPDISERMLCARLRELELEGVVTRQAQAHTPVRIEYRLTDKGRALERVFAAVGEWAERYCHP